MASPIPPKKFLNDPADAVTELINGLLLQYPNKLQKLQNHNVLLSSSISSSSSKDDDTQKVHILSGGGSGHEPSHAGWISGSNGCGGMLSGAILGGIFASPSVASILAAIRAVTPVVKNENSSAAKGGCLLIVKNYTGDRLNFGLACELANAESRPTQMVVVADDAAVPRTKGVTGARGVAGTVLVHKVAGAAAKSGKYSLSEIKDLAERVAGRVRSLGVALDAVTVPGATSVNDRLSSKGEEQTIEIGLGIHGEAGMQQCPIMSADDIVDRMVQTIQEFGIEDKDDNVVPTFEKGDEVAVMVNNLGGTSNFEMSLLANSVVKRLEAEGVNCTVSRLYVGSFMTSFDMQGASISILSLSNKNVEDNDTIKELLDEETDAIAWQNADVWKASDGPRASLTELPEVVVEGESESTKLSYTHVSVELNDFSNNAKKALTATCNSLIESEPLLTKYDTIVGDGDCGFTMKRGATEILKRLDSRSVSDCVDTSHPVLLFDSLATAVSASMGGTSGVLLELMFRSMSTFLNSKNDGEDTVLPIDAKQMRRAFDKGVKAVSFYGGASLGSRTMLDALLPAVDEFCSNDYEGSFKRAVEAAVKGAEGTATMGSASAGRSNYLSEDALAGTPDPGAMAVSIVMKAIFESL